MATRDDLQVEIERCKPIRDTVNLDKPKKYFLRRAIRGAEIANELSLTESQARWLDFLKGFK